MLNSHTLSRGAALITMALVLSLTAFLCTAAERLDATVVNVIDGDTLSISTTGCQDCRVRLLEIDAPESDQPYGDQSRAALIELTGGAGARIELATDGRDRYGRILATVYRDGVNLNAEMIRRGAAHVYERYSDSPVLLELQDEAKEDERGLWNLEEADRKKPWEWRHAGVSPPDWDAIADKVAEMLTLFVDVIAELIGSLIEWLQAFESDPAA